VQAGTGMTTPQEDFQRFLDGQRAEYRSALPGKVQEIQQQWAAVVAAADASQALNDLRRLAHSLAGTAGTLGFREVGQAAKALEALLEEDAEENQPVLSPGLRANVDLALSALQHCLPDQA
jgi:chemotaxis protein histidine kinase CheA